MTKKHFNRFVRILGDNQTAKGYSSDLLADLCDYFLEDNPLFDEHRFRATLDKYINK